MATYNENGSPIENTTFASSSGEWHIPPGVSLITNIECSGGGGDGGDGGNAAGGGGGGGGGYSALPNVQVNGGRTVVTYSANRTISVSILNIPVPVSIIATGGGNGDDQEYLAYDGTGAGGGSGSGGLYNYSGSKGEDGYNSGHGGRGGAGASFSSGNVPNGVYGPAQGIKPGALGCADNGTGGNGGGGGGDASCNYGGSGSDGQLVFTYFRADAVTGGTAFVHCTSDRVTIYGTEESVWTVPPGIFCIDIELWGAGGGGSAPYGAGGPYFGAGGGGGGYCKLESVEVNPGDQIHFHVGTGGWGGIADSIGDSGTGGNTTCVGFGMTAFGGLGAYTGDTYLPGDGGTATGGDINANGSDADLTSGQGGAGAVGGGDGGVAGIARSDRQYNGWNGTAPGGGGGAGIVYLSYAGLGGAGADGRITFTYPVPHHYKEKGSGGAVTGGKINIPVNGLIAGGSATSYVLKVLPTSGGMITGGSSVPKVKATKISTGGMITGGTTNGLFVVASGGAKTGGRSIISRNTLNRATGGCVAGGTSRISLNISKTTSGGVITGGISIFRRFFLNVGAGGTITGGTNKNTQRSQNIGHGGVVVVINWFGISSGSTIIASERGHGGIKARGHCKIEKIKFRLPITESGIQGCFENTEEPATLLSIENNPRQEITGVWCPIDGTCGGILPKIIVDRQKGFVPDANGTLNPRDRGTAIYSKSNDTVFAQAIVGGKVHRIDPRKENNKTVQKEELPKTVNIQSKKKPKPRI